MTTFIYRCPATGLNVQGWVAEHPSSENGSETYESVICTACTRMHLVNPKTGRTLGADEE
jgi:hypothetical protein